MSTAESQWTRLSELSPRARAVIDGLEAIFLREGFRRVSVGELAARLHCSRQTLYALAPSKEELFLLVLDQLLARIRRLGLEAAAARGDVRERIVACVEPGVSELREASRAFFADVAGFPRAKRRLDLHQAARRGDISRLLEDGIRAGAFRGVHPHLAAEIILAAVRRAMEPAFLLEAGLLPSDAIAEAEDLLLYGLLHPEGRAQRSTRTPAARRSRKRGRR